MGVRNITADQVADRLEWLMGAAGRGLADELTRMEAGGDTARLVEELDRIKHAAEECAKHIRNEAGWQPGEPGSRG